MILARRCHPRSVLRGRKWVNDRETGGVLNYAGTHNIDLVCWFMSSKPVRVYAEMGQLVLEGQDFTDSAVMTFLFENGGVAAMYESFGYPDPYPHGVDRSLEVLGKKGSLVVDLMRQPLAVHSSEGFQIHDAVTWPRVNGELRGALLTEVEHFVRAVREGRPVLTSGETGLRAVRLANAAREAFTTGRAVSV
jgi:predicted dehydrogenase